MKKKGWLRSLRGAGGQGDGPRDDVLRRESTGVGVAEAGVWVLKSTQRLSQCLDAVSTLDDKQAYVVRWHGETLRRVLEEVQSLETLLSVSLDNHAVFPPERVVETAQERKNKSVALSRNPAHTALRLGLEHLDGVAVGGASTFLWTDTGKALACGCNTQGALCLGKEHAGARCVPHPTSCVSLGHVRVTEVALGKAHALVVTDNGLLYSVGANGSGQLGVGDTETRSGLCLVGTNGASVCRAAAGHFHSLCLTDDGSVCAFGNGPFGQLGLGDTSNHLTPTVVPYLQAEPAAAARSHQHLQTASASHHDAATKRGGVQGRDEEGRGERLSGRVVDVSGGADHSVVVTSDGHVYAFGRGVQGRLGIGGSGRSDMTEPALVPGLEMVHVVSAQAGDKHTVVLGQRLHNGQQRYEVYTFGCGSHGQLGHGDTADQFFPKRVEALDAHDVSSIRAGMSCTFCLTKDGRVMAFGSNAYGRLGLVLQGPGDEGHDELERRQSGEDGTAAAPPMSARIGLQPLAIVTSPRPVQLPEGVKAAKVTCGFNHSVVIGQDRRAYVWGRNTEGQLGLGTDDVVTHGVHCVEEIVAEEEKEVEGAQKSKGVRLREGTGGGRDVSEGAGVEVGEREQPQANEEQRDQEEEEEEEEGVQRRGTSTGRERLLERKLNETVERERERIMEVKECRGRIKQLEDCCAAFKEEVSGLQEESQTQRATITRLEAELAAEQATTAKRAREYERALARAHDLESRWTPWVEGFHTYRGVEKYLRDVGRGITVKELAADHKELAKRCDAQARDIRRMTEEGERLSKNNGRLETKVSQLEKRLHYLVNDRQASIRRESGAESPAKRRGDALKAQVLALQESNARYAQRQDDMASAVASLQRKLALVEAEAARVREETKKRETAGVSSSSSSRDGGVEHEEEEELVGNGGTGGDG